MCPKLEAWNLFLVSYSGTLKKKRFFLGGTRGHLLVGSTLV